ncbi:hypothetical protein JHK82_049785 [Glycine max]|nr:hypothetical protein JHK85_050406 [Glycine max]KAG5091007.1 hypothetical protein JHK82_049785 [Glycine max]KAG5094108.1 hypothetical protein JHK84_049696 [Glycine max]
MVFEIPNWFLPKVSALSLSLSRDFLEGSPTRNGTTYEHNSTMAEPRENEEAEEVAEVKGLCGGVEATVGLEGWWFQECAVERVAGDGLDQTALFDVRKEKEIENTEIPMAERLTAVQNFDYSNNGGAEGQDDVE